MSSPSLIEQAAAKLGPDGVWKALHPFIPSLQEPRNGQVEVRALCPNHDDHRPSWCWNLAKGIAQCHKCDRGTSYVRVIAQHTGRQPVMVLDSYCQKLGLPRPRRRILTLADYGEAKNLPVEFLQREFNLSDGPNGVIMPYMGDDGETIADRRRLTLGSKPRWPRGTKARRMVYGKHGLHWIGPTGYLLWLEGESDLQTAWYHGYPALATPGANLGHAALAESVVAAGIHTSYVVPDDDLGGRVMVQKSDRALRVVGWKGQLLVARLPTKDLSDLHVQHPDTFDAALSAALHGAQTVVDVLTGWDRQEATEDAMIGQLTRKVLADRNLNATDKMIVLTAAISVGGDVGRLIPLTKSRLAKSAGVPRRTFYYHLPELLETGALEQDGDGLRLGRAVVR